MICFCVAFGWSLFLISFEKLLSFTTVWRKNEYEVMKRSFQISLRINSCSCLLSVRLCYTSKLRGTFLHFVHLYLSYCISWKWPFIGTNIGTFFLWNMVDYSYYSYGCCFCCIYFVCCALYATLAKTKVQSYNAVSLIWPYISCVIWHNIKTDFFFIIFDQAPWMQNQKWSIFWKFLNGCHLLN